MTEDKRYEDLAHQAYVEFLGVLQRHLNDSGMSQAKLAELTGYRESTVSVLLRTSTRVTEPFIRAVVDAIPELSAEYFAFRQRVDAPWMPDKGKLDPAVDEWLMRMDRVYDHVGKVREHLSGIRGELKSL